MNSFLRQNSPERINYPSYCDVANLTIPNYNCSPTNLINDRGCPDLRSTDYGYSHNVFPIY